MTEEINKKIKELEEKITSLESELRKQEEGISEGSSEDSSGRISKDSKNLKNSWVLIESDDTIIKSRPDSGDTEVVRKKLEEMDWKEIHEWANKFRPKI